MNKIIFQFYSYQSDTFSSSINEIELYNENLSVFNPKLNSKYKVFGSELINCEDKGVYSWRFKIDSLSTKLSIGIQRFLGNTKYRAFEGVWYAYNSWDGSMTYRESFENIRWRDPETYSLTGIKGPVLSKNDIIDMTFDTRKKVLKFIINDGFLRMGSLDLSFKGVLVYSKYGTHGKYKMFVNLWSGSGVSILNFSKIFRYKKIEYVE